MQIISGMLTVIMIDYIEKRGNVLATGCRIRKFYATTEKLDSTVNKIIKPYSPINVV